jgi:hypothetical protein
MKKPVQKIQIEGRTFYHCHIQSFLKEVPELGERVSWWDGELGGVFKPSKTAFSVITKITNPFSDFTIKTNADSFRTKFPKGYRFNKENPDLHPLLQLLLNNKKVNLPENCDVVIKIRNIWSGECWIDYWTPSMGYVIEDRKRKIDFYSQDFDKAMLKVSEDYETVWNEMMKFVPYFIAARHEVQTKMEKGEL